MFAMPEVVWEQHLAVLLLKEMSSAGQYYLRARLIAHPPSPDGVKKR